MLHTFLTAQRAALIQLCREKVLRRRVVQAGDASVETGIPRFIEQLITTLQIEQGSEPLQSRKVSGPSDGGMASSSDIGASAAQHGLVLLKSGCTIDQVVHEYGDLCQAITEMACSHAVPVSPEEFQTVNRCLDNAIADAVTEFSHGREAAIVAQSCLALNARLGFLAHELRNLTHIATLAFGAIKTGNVGPTGSTGAVLERSLTGLCTLIDRTLADVRAAAAIPPRFEHVSVALLIAELKISASLDAQARNCRFCVSPVDPHLAVDADRDLLLSAAGNLLQNAFKFTKPQSEVSLHAYGTADRIRIEVEDHCGGLPAGMEERLFRPFTQGGADRSGLGLGLSISRGLVEANNGTLSVRDIPGSGCIFTIDLPRYALPQLSVDPI